MKLNNFPIIRDRRLRVGVVGCGRISKNHFGSIFDYPDDLELTAVCDIDHVALEHATTEYGVQGYHELKDMLSLENLDLVVLYPEDTPTKLAATQACARFRKTNGNS